MKALLDTHALLWWLFDDERLPVRVRGLLSDPDNTLVVSSASAWEIATKFRIGKLPSAAVLTQDMAGWIRKAGFQALSISIEHAQKAGAWAVPHRDPFDRMLAAQSALENLPLVSDDEHMQQFGIALFW